MKKRKQFNEVDARTTVLSTQPEKSYSDTSKVIELPPNPSGARRLDFSSWYDRGIDSIASACHTAIYNLLNNGSTEKSCVSYYRSTGYLISFCELKLKKDLTFSIKSINKLVIKEYITWLQTLPRAGGGTIEATTQKSCYSQTKSVLKELVRLDILSNEIGLFPINPFPGINGKYKGHRAFSISERKRIISSLKIDIKSIISGTFEGTNADRLGILALTVALRTGLNTTPLLELSQNCLTPHPFKTNYQILTTRKRRSNSIFQTPLVSLDEESDQISVKGDTLSVLRWAKKQALQFNHDVPIQYSDRLWLYVDSSIQGKGRITCLTESTLGISKNKFIERHNLKTDDGEPLKLNISRFRKSFVNSIYDISKDPIITAKISGHTVKVSEGYLEATPEMQRNFKFAGTIILKQLSKPEDTPPQYNTPVAGCSDPVNGEYADGSARYCMKFLNCFKCRNMVITGEDLWRLFSFYWLLINERSLIPSKQWASLYSTVIDIIDNSITKNFPPKIVERERTRAKIDPHPFWLDRSLLLAGA
ncbi:hypothetical protein K3369_19535 [Pseudomonas mandelii]|uniref:hypothetical protein n=1 Tax=Pseudomonas mandelii TaxID=75612 RepID=UPI001C8369A9|nr:hypothetical protein [Pseudomonas mandelii]QZA95959.1 hypothetical protein K3369_19535 [Pseudomonas mandelii]